MIATVTFALTFGCDRQPRSSGVTPFDEDDPDGGGSIICSLPLTEFVPLTAHRMKLAQLKAEFPDSTMYVDRKTRRLVVTPSSRAELAQIKLAIEHQQTDFGDLPCP